ncbi:MAG: hypothetical protein V4617_21050 [Gemmatimonadota bacterium]
MSIDDVRTLVGERQRYDDWLTALEGRRGNTPARVFERVHADYAGRRAAVMEQLSGHIDTLASMGESLDSRLSALDSSLASLEDEHVEATLRTAVGEFDTERWENVRQQVEARIAEVSTERSALLTELEDVRTLLASARNEPRSAPTPVESAAPVQASMTAGATGPASGANDAIFTASAMPELLDTDDVPGSVSPSASSSADTSKYESSVTESVANESLATVESSAGEPSAEALDLDDALALFSPADANDGGSAQLDARPVDVSHGASVDGAVSRAATLTPPAASAAPAGQAPGVAAQDDTFDDLAFLRSVIDPADASSSARGASAAPAAAAQKTLRCTECGTMNLPTEWYCERCGGELAAF